MNSLIRRSRGFVFAVVVFAGWAGSSLLNLVNPILIPPPWSVGRAIGTILIKDQFTADLAITAWRVVVALAVAAAFGVPAGLVLGHHREVYAFVERPLHALRSVPATALFPLLLIVVGVGEASITVLAAYPSLLVVIVNAALGAGLANQRRVAQARRIGISDIRLLTDVLFFEALPHIFGALRVAVSYALALVVAVEMFIGTSTGGIGRRIYDYQSAYLIPETYAAILLAGALGVVFNGGLDRIERLALAWIPNATTGR